MDRTTWITIGSETYPLLCTIGALDRINARFGSMEGWAKAIVAPETMYSATLDTLELFLAQGCAHENYFSNTLPNFPAGGYKPLPREALESYYTMEDFPELSRTLGECFRKSQKNEIEGTSKKK